jgi:peptide deformylase
MIRPILQLGHPMLRQVSADIDPSDGALPQLWEDLPDTLTAVMRSHVFRNCAGLSAVQIGVLRRACVIWLPETGFHHLVNPQILTQSEEHALEYEGCLSFFDKRGRASRPNVIAITYLDRSFQRINQELTGWAARILLHELDHMDGILYTDRMSSAERLIGYDEVTPHPPRILSTHIHMTRRSIRATSLTMANEESQLLGPALPLIRTPTRKRSERPLAASCFGRLLVKRQSLAP